MLTPISPSLRADPLADDTIARILGPSAGRGAPPLAAIGIVNRLIGQWQLNADLPHWHAPEGTPPHIAVALQDYLRTAHALPDWADRNKIARAENLFMDIAMMSCTLLFCASLPECYVFPDLAAVLRVSGQLEQRTDYRIRSTAAMIFPVMMHGGLTATEGGGIAQILKVRLIHATIRHLILRQNPGLVTRAGQASAIAPQPAAGAGMYEAMYAHGWDVPRHGLPINQEELAYTLLTFHYIYLRGLRKLGIGASREDEEAYLHAWNVAGHMLGIERSLMPPTMDAAETLFNDLQQHSRAAHWQPDPRPGLTAALMNMMADEIPVRLLKSFPVLLTRHLCGPVAARELGLNDHVGLLPRAVFVVGLGLTRALDACVRLIVPGFSLARLATRIVGYRFTVRLLMDQTRPLKLPDALLGKVVQSAGVWRADPRAPKWMNRVENKFADQARKRKDPHA